MRVLNFDDMIYVGSASLLWFCIWIFAAAVPWLGQRDKCWAIIHIDEYDEKNTQSAQFAHRNNSLEKR